MIGSYRKWTSGPLGRAGGRLRATFGWPSQVGREKPLRVGRRDAGIFEASEIKWHDVSDIRLLMVTYLCFWNVICLSGRPFITV